MKFIKKINQKDIDISNQKLTYFIMIFFTCAIIGFVYEELLFLVTEGVIVKRGFLYGPYLPIYGWGAVLMAALLKKFKNRPFKLVLLSMILISLLEYFTGYFMYLIWHKRWWDYTGAFLSINGFICFKSVVCFSLFALLLIYIIEPLIKIFMDKLKRKNVNILCSIFLIVYLIDNVFAFLIKNSI